MQYIPTHTKYGYLLKFNSDCHFEYIPQQVFVCMYMHVNVHAHVLSISIARD